MPSFEALEKKMESFLRSGAKSLYERAKLLDKFWGQSGLRSEYSRYVGDAGQAADKVVGWFSDTAWKPTDIWQMYNRRPDDPRWLTGDIGGINVDVGREITHESNPSLSGKRNGHKHSEAAKQHLADFRATLTGTRTDAEAASQDDSLENLPWEHHDALNQLSAKELAAYVSTRDDCLAIAAIYAGVSPKTLKMAFLKAANHNERLYKAAGH